MSDLGFNKIAGAVLATGLAVVGLHYASSMAFEPEVAAKQGYAVEVAEDTGGATAAPELPVDGGTVLPTANIAAGQAQFAKCSSCHQPTSFEESHAVHAVPANRDCTSRSKSASTSARTSIAAASRSRTSDSA